MVAPRRHTADELRSFFAASLGSRLIIAASAAALLWLATLWALEVI